MSHPHPRWLVLTTDFPPGFVGGVASWALDLSLALQEAGEAVEVFARRTPETTDFDASIGPSIHRMRGRHWGRWQGTWARLTMGRAMRKHDIVLAASWRVAAGLAPLVQRRGARLAITFHGSEITRLRTAPPALLRIANSADALLPVSNFLARELQRLGVVAPDDPRVRVLPMPVPHRAQVPRGSGLVCVARPTPLKGIDRAQHLAQTMGLPLTLVGTDGHVSRIQAMDAMAEATAIVLLPRVDAHGMGAEGLGLVLLEAAMMGIPSIGCRTGGVPEAVGPGLLLDNPDNPNIGQVATFLADSDAGTCAHNWAREHHGPERTLHVLREAFPCG
jgi:glycosyltransferase involved in cell wall biosynthesis